MLGLGPDCTHEIIYVSCMCRYTFHVQELGELSHEFKCDISCLGHPVDTQFLILEILASTGKAC